MTICLCMIVKNEAHVIARSLASVAPLIDSWVIVDTGSTDGTQHLAEIALAGVPGEVVERPWVDFGANRSEALALARDKADYALVIDADDVLAIEPGFVMPALSADAYDLDIRLGDLRYQRPQIFANRLPWRYRGVLHEFADCDGAGPRAHLPGVTMVCGNDGARRQDPEKYRRDAAVLERALETESDPLLVSRYTFYLAQSWRDAGEPTFALKAYLARADLGHWNEEVYISLLNAVRLMIGHDCPAQEILSAADRAASACSNRVEVAVEIARYLRLRSQFEAAYQTAATFAAVQMPAAGLFVEPDAYRFALLDELGISAYWSGRPKECLAACLDILRNDRAPAEHRDRIVTNASFALSQLSA